MREFVIVYMVDAGEVGQRFTRWPLHMTLLPWFTAPDIQTVKAALADELIVIKPFAATPGARAYLGQRRLPVRLVTKTKELQALHERLLDLINRNGWGLRGRYVGPQFKPHVTQKAGRDAGDTLMIDRLHIVEKQPLNYRQIVGEIML